MNKIDKEILSQEYDVSSASVHPFQFHIENPTQPFQFHLNRLIFKLFQSTLFINRFMSCQRQPKSMSDIFVKESCVSATKNENVDVLNPFTHVIMVVAITPNSKLNCVVLVVANRSINRHSLQFYLHENTPRRLFKGDLFQIELI